MTKIIVIGGGAAGFMAAITAARAGGEVVILEKDNKPLKKFAKTGNGRCNLTNLIIKDDSFRGHDVMTARRIVDIFPPGKTTEFFARIGLPVFDKNSWVYPICESAKSAAAMLEKAAARLGVSVKTLQDVRSLKYDGKKVFVSASGWTYEADVCIAACGTNASLTGRDNSFAEYIAGKFSLKLYPYLPALSKISSDDNAIKDWPKIRAKAAIALYVDGVETARERGELQLSQDGISGIAAMQLSRYAEEALHDGKKCELLIDFMPDFEAHDLEKYISDLMINGLSANDALTGFLPGGIVHSFACEDPHESALRIKNFKLKDLKQGSSGSAQVCQGGIALSSLDETLKIPGVPVWLCGEMLDVDGDCGGYNLQWAWSSGYLAGLSAVGKKI